MQIHMWPRERAGELFECYNRQVRDVPYCYPQSPETFATGVEEDLAELFGFHRPEVLTSEELIVAEEGGNIVGFLDHGLHEKSEGDETKRVCVLRFMAYEPGRRAVGQALLDRAEAEYAKRGATEVAAFPKGYIYHFCSPEGGLSSLAGNVVGLLGLNGYTVSGRTVNLVRESLSIQEPDLPDPSARISVNGERRRSRLPSVMVNANVDKDGEETSVGECLAYPWEYVQSTQEAQDQIYINWMGIGREFQGNGWGRYLLWRTLTSADEVGYRQCVLGTAETNSRALAFYTNYGFRVAHTSYSYTKDLEADDQ